MVPPEVLVEPAKRKSAPPAIKTPAPSDPTDEFPRPNLPAPPGFRPRQRPPLALLTVLDDGRDGGEVFRLRNDSTIIGRSQGDVQVPHDELISGRHAEIRRTREGGAWHWVLTDLGSTNGTFVKIAALSLKAGQELQVGYTRLRFDVPEVVDPSSKNAMPSLVEVTPEGQGRRFPLLESDNWIGTEPGCAVALADDPLVAGKHAHLYCDAKGVWHLGEGSGRDGVWLRRDRVVIDKSCSFQCGEQRFLLRVP